MDPGHHRPPPPATSVAGLLEHFLTAEDLQTLNQASFPAAHRIRASRTGAHKARLRGGTTEFADHRPYSPGDEVRRLDWRIVGRSERLEVKLYEDPSTLDNVFLLDGSGSMKFADSTRSKFSYGCSVVAFLSKILLGQHDPVGLAIAIERGPAFLPPKSSTLQLAQMLGSMRPLEAQGKTYLTEQIRYLAKNIRNPTRVMIISDCFLYLKSLEKELKLLVGRGHRFHLLHTVAPEEVSLSYRQPVRFTSLEDSQRIDAKPQEIVQAYLAAMRKHVEGLRKICLHYGAGYEPLVTNRPLGRALVDFIRRQAERKN
jgi:uncharacterized protein (DUF58 family)